MEAPWIDLQHVQLPPDTLPLGVPVPATPSRRRPQGRFLKGPIPLVWRQAAAQLPGKALHVGIALWFLVGVQGSLTVPLTPSLLRQFGINRHAGYRAVHALEGAALVRVRRHRGRGPVVTVVGGPGGGPCVRGGESRLWPMSQAYRPLGRHVSP